MRPFDCAQGRPPWTEFLVVVLVIFLTGAAVAVVFDWIYWETAAR